MQIGFKTGPQTFAEGKHIVTETAASLCEMWFRVDRAKEYTEMLTWLEKHGVAIGLHHWGLVNGRYKTNLATHHRDVADATIQQVKDTIDIGQQIGAAYVNAHAGARQVETLDFKSNRQQLADRAPTPAADARQNFIAAVDELHAYAEDRNVVLTFETLPGREASILGSARDDPYDAGNASLDDIRALVGRGNIANDITHTAGTIAASLDEENPEQFKEAMWEALSGFTQDVAAATRLLHINTVVPPYNGTDSHDGILPEDFARGVWPDRDQLKTLLTMFEDRDDVFVIPEPHSDMLGNYQALVELVQEKTEGV